MISCFVNGCTNTYRLRKIMIPKEDGIPDENEYKLYQLRYICDSCLQKNVKATEVTRIAMRSGGFSKGSDNTEVKV